MTACSSPARQGASIEAVLVGKLPLRVLKCTRPLCCALAAARNVLLANKSIARAQLLQPVICYHILVPRVEPVGAKLHAPLKLVFRKDIRGLSFGKLLLDFCHVHRLKGAKGVRFVGSLPCETS